MHLTPGQVAPYFEAPDPYKYAKTNQRATRLINIIWGLNVVGVENVPNSGAGVVAFVHRSVLDPWIMGAAIPRAVGGMGKIELLNWYYFGIGSKYLANRGVSFIDRDNPSHDSLRPARQTLEANKLYAMSPEGTAKNKGREISKLENGVARIAAKVALGGVDCKILPVAITSEDLYPGNELQVVIGVPIDPLSAEFKARRPADRAAKINEHLSSALQNLNDQAWNLRETRNQRPEANCYYSY